MAHVRDLWTKPNSDKASRKKRVRSSRWGTGKRWQVVWEENGVRTTKSFQTEDGALAYKARVEVGQADGTWITKDKAAVTFSDLWEAWIEAKPDIAPSTRAGYVAAWAHLQPTWGEMCIAEFNPAVFPTWVAGLKTRRPHQKTEPTPLGSGAKRKVGIVMNALLDMAVKNKIIRENPLGKGNIVRQEPATKRALRISEADALLAAAPTENARLLTEVMLRTGIRPGEAKGLKVKDLDYYRGRLVIRRSVDQLGHPGPTKSRRDRDVPVGGDLLLDLDDMAAGRDDEDWLIPDEHGNVWTDARWRRAFDNMCTEAGLDGITTYTLKHTAVTMAIAAGADVYAVQRMCGHASAAITLDYYGHLWDAGLDAVPGAMDAHMEREREREKTRLERRAERETRGRGKLRAVES